MKFIDNTGHIFELDDYNVYPEGYEYNENKYVFWFDGELNSKLSINCYYIKPIRILIDKKITKKSKINISIDKSNNFKLLSSRKVQELLEQKQSIFSSDYIEFDENEHFVYKLSSLNYPNDPVDCPYNGDFCELNNLINDEYYVKDTYYKYFGEIKESKNVDGSINYIGIVNSDDNGLEYVELNKIIKEYTMIPFYVVTNVEQEGTWLTNILIHIEDNDETNGLIDKSIYCPITVGGVFYDEIEELIINGKNMGINLPKDILRSFYDTSFYNDVPNINLWNNKIKELLLNYMNIKGEIGNFNSVINTLKWFGYGDKLSIYKLLKTDNEFIDQYITDNFFIDGDIINNFLLFKNTTYISLSLPGVGYNNEIYNNYNFDDDFWGEGNPKLINYFEETINKTIDETGIEYITQYYNFGFNELGLKLSCLKYYFEKYFLPIHINIYRASISNQCFSNNIKLLNNVSTHITSNSVYIGKNNINLNFPINNTIWISNQIHYIDDNFNEFNNYSYFYNNNISLNNNIYYLDDICFSIPIDFCPKSSDEQYYNVNLILLKDENIIIETSFNFLNKVEYIYKLNNTLYTGNYNDIIIEFDMTSNLYKYYTITNDNGIQLKQELERISSNTDYNSLIVYPKFLSNGNDYDLYNWINSNYKLLMLVNNVWYTYEFKIKLPELDIRLGKLKYNYNYNQVKQFTGIKNNKILFNSNINDPNFVTVHNAAFINNLSAFMKNNHLNYINENMSIMRNNTYMYYYNFRGYKCIFSIDIINKNTIKYYVFTNDPNYNDYNDYINNINNDVKFDDGNFTLYNLTFSEEYDYSKQLEELKLNINNHTVFIHKNIYSFLDYYNENINLPNDINNILNRIHVFMLYNLTKDENDNIVSNKINYTSENDSYEFEIKLENNNTLKFGVNDSNDIISLYRIFFNSSGNFNCNIYYNDNNKWILDNELSINNDFYLMHDDKYWYVICISKYPISNKEKLFIPNKIYKLINKTNIDNEIYLKYERSDNKLLINRISFEDTLGINKFMQNDVIACKIENIDLPINIIYGSKWNIKPLSIGIKNTNNITSNTNICIMSIGNNIKYEKGYYEIQVKYALDKNQNITEEKTTKILIE